MVSKRPYQGVGRNTCAASEAVISSSRQDIQVTVLAILSVISPPYISPIVITVSAFPSSSHFPLRSSVHDPSTFRVPLPHPLVSTGPSSHNVRTAPYIPRLRIQSDGDDNLSIDLLEVLAEGLS